MARLELGPPGFFNLKGLTPRAGDQYIHLIPPCTLRENGCASLPRYGKSPDASN
jgi:hypothetical protein